MLMQHLELSHPENGESPFIAREESPVGSRRRCTSDPRPQSVAGKGSRSSSLAPAAERVDEDFYVDCPLRCGEAVHIRELEDHMDLHDVESQGFDDIEQAASSRHASPVPLARRSSSIERPIRDYGTGERPSSRRSGELLAASDGAVPRRNRESSTLHNLKELLLGPAPRKTRPIEARSKTGAVRRLGVGSSFPPVLTRLIA